MRKREKKLEVLAPAGSFGSMQAAVHAGADAVYMGGRRFGARAYAENPEDEELLRAIDYAHLYGAKLYLTVNTLLKERELEGELYAYMRPLYERGLDAVIVQDMGVLCAVREWFPDLSIHASTQMTVCGAGGVRFLAQQDVKRVVLARELSFSEMEEIHRNTDLELECFVHGALCYCYSGQCLFSSLLGGRSGNRGRCAQPCRLSYDVLAGGRTVSKQGENALLSPKDLCALELLPRIAEAGAHSLKLEGRMKRPEYAAGVTRIYRKYVDLYERCGAKGYEVSEEDRKELQLLFNRQGFSQGYYLQHNGRNMMALKGAQDTKQERKEYERLIASLKKEYVDTEKKIFIEGYLRARAGLPLELKINAAGLHEALTVWGDCPQKADKCPMEAAQLERPLRKTGGTPFVWERLEIDLEEELFVPVQVLNSLRREALEELRRRLCTFRGACKARPQGETVSEGPEGKAVQALALHISVETKGQLFAVLELAGVLKYHREAPLAAVYLDAEGMEEGISSQTEAVHRAGLKAYVVLPAIFRMDTADRYEKNSAFWRHLPADGYVIKNLEEYDFLRRIGWSGEYLLDHNMYTFNKRSRAFWRGQGIHMQTNPLELNAAELRALCGADVIQIIYGRSPMMTTAGCLHKTLGQCRRRPEVWVLKDRYRKEFPVKNCCQDCYNVIYNSQPLCLFDRQEELRKLGAGAFRILFTVEDAKEVYAVLRSFLDGEKVQAEFTRGHFKRGVE